MHFKISVNELKEGFHKIPFPVECKKIAHVDLTFGYRIDVDNKTITYLCDTGICDSSKLLAKNTDVVLHECSMGSGISNDAWGHVSQIGAARVAKEAGAKKLFLTHISVKDLGTKLERKKAQAEARKIFKNTYCAVDDMKVEI